jgi:hypothetical protein
MPLRKAAPAGNLDGQLGIGESVELAAT